MDRFSDPQAIDKFGPQRFQNPDQIGVYQIKPSLWRQAKRWLWDEKVEYGNRRIAAYTIGMLLLGVLIAVAFFRATGR